LLNKKKIGGYKLGVIKNLLSEIVVALGHVHECGFIYGRISLDNVIVNYDGHVMLTSVSELRKGGKIIRERRRVMSYDSLLGDS
jgi:serine/threonine protein kinase